MSQTTPEPEDKKKQSGKAGIGNVNQITGNNNRIGGANISFWLSMPIVLLVVLGGAYFWFRSNGDGYNFPKGQPPSEMVSPTPKP